MPPGEAHPVHAAVLKEAVVLGGQHGLPHQRRDVLEAHRNAQLLPDLGNQFPVAGKDPERHGQRHVAHGLGRGQGGGQVDEGAGEGKTYPQDKRCPPQGGPA